jgi:hypothetical protein
MFEKYKIFYLIPPAPLKRGVKVPLFKGDLGGSLSNSYNFLIVSPRV